MRPVWRSVSAKVRNAASVTVSCEALIQSAERTIFEMRSSSTLPG